MFRRSSSVPCALLVVAVLTATAGTLWADTWVVVRSPHFTVAGNVSEKRARDVATKFEQFREVLLRLFPGARLAVRPPLVVAFDSEKSFKPFKPLYDGKPGEVAGYCALDGDGTTVITLQLDRGRESYPVIFHEYTHLFLNGMSRGLPSWLNEGVAEYYSTVEIAKQGLEADIARPIGHHLLLLQQRTMPLRELLTTTRTSALWSRPEEAAVFYAQSWALVHLLSLQDGGAEKFDRLGRRLAAGAPDIAAFEETFGPVATVEQALRRYVQKGLYGHWRFRFSSRISADEAPARPMRPAEVAATQARILIHLGRHEEAARHVAAAATAAADAVEALLARGLLERGQGLSTESEKSLRAAAAAGPGDLDAAYYWGLAMAEKADADEGTLERAAAGLKAALPADDPAADALGVLGVLQGRSGRLDEAEATLRQSLRLMPRQTGVMAGLAQVLIRLEKFEDARGLLGPMIARPSYPGEEELARRILASLATAERQARTRASLARASGAPATGADAEAASATRSQPEGTRSLRGRGFRLLFRTIGEGERREEGRLERIECSQDGLVVVLATSNGAMRFHAPGFDDVEFITYRDDLRGAVACGPRKNAEVVYLTWRAAGEPMSRLGTLAGRVVAVEFLPD